MMGRLRHLLETLRRDQGEWTLFAALWRKRALWKWDLILAAPWLV